MILSHFELDEPLILSPDVVNVLVVENENKFWDYCNTLLEQFEGKGGLFSLYDKDKKLSFSKDVTVIYNYFDFSFNDRKTQNILYSSLSKITENSFAQEYEEIAKRLVAFFDMLDGEMDFPLEYDPEVGIQGLFKAYGVCWQKASGSLAERLISMIQFYTRILRIKCFVFINLKCFLCADELEAFYQEISLQEISVLLLESTCRQKLNKEKITVIDKDLCEFVV